jgi:hypothetical protein
MGGAHLAYRHSIGENLDLGFQIGDGGAMASLLLLRTSFQRWNRSEGWWSVEMGDSARDQWLVGWWHDDLAGDR